MTPDSALVSRLSPSPNFGDRRGRAIDALILHYTGMASGAAARDRLLDPAAEVSCHYLVWEDGRIEQLVAEADRAWHAGRASWAGETDLNSCSIGIEIVNGGHDYGCPPYPDAQIAATIDLCRDICARHRVAPGRVLGHADVAPDRKQDPGEHFPWARLAAAGVGLWVPVVVKAAGETAPGQHITDWERPLQKALAGFGYHCPETGDFDAATRAAFIAFLRHFAPAGLGSIDDPGRRARLALGTLQALEALQTAGDLRP